MKRKATTAAFALFALGCSWLGCTGLASPVAEPEVELREVAVVSVSMTGALLRATFVVTNPNSVAIPIEAVDYDVAIGGADPFRGQIRVDQTIPAYGSAPVALDLEIDPMTAADTIRRLSAGERDYRINGTVHLRSPVGRLSVVFSEEGTIDETMTPGL